ncbi:M24 family metallopeptidase [Natronolimnobius sp. AArcel1]|uniref:M24 family metallopeptidase n=1 Tax=Natronolimnobius sp. AArcel1 TaxID=1679093 RepID=UPI0013ED6355|nr:M24 family metallopeptidase [Natronolimnobius sp. AArcel1]NGM67638.1 M24 family metallopeptidase [Natronolimnobius sp. AArcel1]
MDNVKRERLEADLESRDLDSVWFARPNSFAWLTGGSNVIDREADAGVAAVGYDGDVCVVTDTIEAARTEAEELPDLEDDVRLEQFDWHAMSLADAIAAQVGADERGAADIDVDGLERLNPTTIRQPLTDRDRERYRELSVETAAAVESVCRELRPEDSELEVASALQVALSARNIEAPVRLVGGSERATQYRHYTPTQTELGDYALVSVTAEKYGLHASCTRTVAFDAPDWLEARHEAATRIDTTELAATQAAAANDAIAGELFSAVQDAYAAVDYEGEWEYHHQGGAAGFAGREWIATPDHEAPVEAPMAYAWNPTVQGAKSEDTALVTDEEIEVLTTTGGWPTTTVEPLELEEWAFAADLPDIELERPDVLLLEDA